MKRLQKLKAGRPIGGKTDDAMLVVITPYNATHPVMREHSRVSRAAQRERAPASMVRRTRNTRL